jgi:hypothetical protein
MFFNISTAPPKFVLGDVSRAPGVDAVDKELGHGSDGDGRRRRRKIPLTDRRRPLDKRTMNLLPVCFSPLLFFLSLLPPARKA